MKLYISAINIKYNQNTSTLSENKFIPILEKEFPDILNEILSHNSQQQPINSNKNIPIPHRDREEYNNFRRRFNNRTRTLTTPTITHQSMVNRSHHFSHSMPETLSTYSGNGHHAYQTQEATQNRGHTHNNSQLRMMNTSHKQQGFYHRSNSSLYRTFPHKYYNHARNVLLCLT